MSSTTFLDGQTVIYASWLNDVNATVYNGTFPNGILNPTTLNATNATITNLTATNLNISFGNFTISNIGSKLYFAYNGTNVASIDSSGNIRALGSVITGTTP